VIQFLKMRDFRGVQSGTLEGLTPLVVLVGPNSSGKSTVLDALLICGALDPKHAVEKAAQRRHAVNPRAVKKPSADTDYSSLFYRSNRIAEIAVKTGSGRRRVVMQALRQNTVDIRWKTSTEAKPEKWDIPVEQFLQHSQDAVGAMPLPGVVNVGLVDSRNLLAARTLEELYTVTSQRGLRKDVKSFITEMLPDVDDLEILAPNNVPTLYLNFADHALPIGLAGDGVQLLLRLVLALTAEPQTTLLLEEPETHMHPGGIRLVANAIHGAVARGVQVVLTTHSLELIDALTLGRPDGHLEQLSIFRLALERGELTSTRSDGKEAALARSSIEDDLR
jgi:predicted ATPase